MARAKRKKNRTKRAVHQSGGQGIGRRGVLWGIGMWLADKAGGGLVSNAVLSAVSKLVPAPVWVTSQTGTARVVSARAVALGASYVVASATVHAPGVAQSSSMP